MSSRLSPTGNGATDSSAPSGDPGIAPDSAGSELRELRLEVAALRSQLARRNADVEEFRKRLVASRNQCERYSAQLKALRGSTSWSITRPLRMRRRKSLNNGWT
jgi:chromosome segregation ATPase